MCGIFIIVSKNGVFLKEQMERIPFAFPTLVFKNTKEAIESYTVDDIEIVNYQCYEKINMQMRK